MAKRCTCTNVDMLLDVLVPLLVVGNMGDWRSQFPILSTTTQTPPKTLVRRVLLFSETMRVVLSYPKKVAFNKPMFGSDYCAKCSSYRSI